jgi:hypothetical protein
VPKGIRHFPESGAAVPFEGTFLPQLAGAGAAGGVILIGGGPVTWTITVTGTVILAGVSIWQTGILQDFFLTYSKGGKQSVAHPWVWEKAKEMNSRDLCQALKDIQDQAGKSEIARLLTRQSNMEAVL